MPTHSVSATFCFFLMDEMQQLVIQATNKKGTSLYGDIWKIVDTIKLMAWKGLLIRGGLNKYSYGLVDELFSTMTGPPTNPSRFYES